MFEIEYRPNPELEKLIKRYEKLRREIAEMIGVQTAKKYGSSGAMMPRLTPTAYRDYMETLSTHPAIVFCNRELAKLYGLSPFVIKMDIADTKRTLAP
jgi:hypothetical protein